MNTDLLEKLKDAELIKFATEFSENYKIFSIGNYVSADKKYHINYVRLIKNGETGIETKEFARVYDRGRIELSKELLTETEEVTADFVFFLILWCAIKKTTITRIEVDTAVLTYCKQKGMDIKTISKAWFKQLEFLSPRADSFERLENLQRFHNQQN